MGRALVLEIAIRSLFGERLAERAAEIGDLFQRPQDYLESPAAKQLPHPFPGTKRSRVRADRRAIDVIIDGEIAHLRSHPSDDPLDVLATLVGDGSISDAEIRDQVATLMGAGLRHDVGLALVDVLVHLAHAWAVGTAAGGGRRGARADRRSVES